MIRFLSTEKNDYLPGERLELELEKFGEYDNNERYHESLQNLIPAGVYFGRDIEILEKRKKIRMKTMKMRRRNHQLHGLI